MPILSEIHGADMSSALIEQISELTRQIYPEYSDEYIFKKFSYTIASTSHGTLLGYIAWTPEGYFICTLPNHPLLFPHPHRLLQAQTLSLSRFLPCP